MEGATYDGGANKKRVADVDVRVGVFLPPRSPRGLVPLVGVVRKGRGLCVQWRTRILAVRVASRFEHHRAGLQTALRQVQWASGALASMNKRVQV